MCTLILLRRPGHAWPLLLAANRDEMGSRPWAPPARHWPERPGVVAGIDLLAGGSWLGLNDRGVVAAMLNRAGSLGPAAGKLSRGLLVLDALEQPSAEAAVQALGRIAADAYRPFNMVVADREAAFWLRDDGKALSVTAVHDGLSMLTAFELDDPADSRIREFMPRFAAAAAPDPGAGDWQDWQELMARRANGADRESGLTFDLPSGYGTRSSALIALPRTGRPIFLFAPGAPDRTPWQAVAA